MTKVESERVPYGMTNTRNPTNDHLDRARGRQNELKQLKLDLLLEILQKFYGTSHSTSFVQKESIEIRFLILNSNSKKFLYFYSVRKKFLGMEFEPGSRAGLSNDFSGN